jgi:hypothetical protein
MTSQHMPSRIVTYAHRCKRPPRKKKAAPLPEPAIVRSGRKRAEASMHSRPVRSVVLVDRRESP